MQKLIKNIDMVQINITAGINEYFFPKNVDWASRVIDRIVLVAPAADIVSPVDGTTHVLKRSEIDNMYFDLYSSDEHQIATGMSAEQILYTNNHPWTPGAQLSTDLSRIFFSQTPSITGCVLLYVFYETAVDLTEEQSSKSLTVTFPLAAGQMLTFQDIVNTYVHVNGRAIRGIKVWGADNAPAYLSLRDHNLTYILRDVYTGLFRPQTLGATAEDILVDPAKLDAIDIDFDYSYIRNAQSVSVNQTITFEY